jgi:uncharacterized DUF497 family protein
MSCIYIFNVFDLRQIAGFDWDEGNFQKSEIKHGISVPEAEQLFLNAPEVMADEKHSGAEKRWLAFGRTDERKLIACAFTVRGDRIRVVSVRPMSRHERKWYEEKHSLRQRSENR